MQKSKTVQYTLDGKPIFLDPFEEIRYYKGIYRVRVKIKSLKNWLVEALEEIPMVYATSNMVIPIGKLFITYHRCLYCKKRKKRKVKIKYRRLYGN